ncbi:MAG: stage II sporulation protein R [Oscillospiraceae bacterium]
MKKYIIDILMAFGAALAIFFNSFTGFAQTCEQMPEHVLRLHIMANSDSGTDQQTKLALRDFVLQKFGTELSVCGSAEDAKRRTAELLPDIETACNAFLKERGADYSAEAQLVNMYFTTRVYDDITMPAGNYDALRITLGTGEGHNWWCIMFPPLCLPAAAKVDSESAAAMEEMYSNSEPQKIEVRFAVYDFFQWLLNKK